jgi:hypothetical protein
VGIAPDFGPNLQDMLDLARMPTTGLHSLLSLPRETMERKRRYRAPKGRTLWSRVLS